MYRLPVTPPLHAKVWDRLPCTRHAIGSARGRFSVLNSSGDALPGTGDSAWHEGQAPQDNLVMMHSRAACQLAPLRMKD
eukprot:3164311-Amphidinium_carterae.1